MQASQLQRILDNLNTAVLALDGELRLTWLNAAAEMMLEVSARQLVGQPFARLLIPDNPLLETLRLALDNGQPYTARGLRLDSAAGKSVTVDCTVSPFIDSAGDTELIVELNQVDRLMRLAREDALLAQHEANRAVLRGMAHEIKNPLGGLRGAAQLLEKELSDRELKEFTRIIIHEADRLRNLVDRMMGSSRPLKSETVNLHRVLEHVRRLIEAEYPHGVRIERDYDPSLPECQGDPDQVTQAILNVVRNSAQAFKDAGTIRLRTRIERQVTIGHIRHRLAVRVDIEDDGPGIPEALMERIFFPMVTSKAEGTGLGLPIAQDIINRHGGLIACRSEPGHTIFSIYLPVENGHEQ
jgi:two-component system nitrogen regulation sensor histidine kinase GlnL